MTVGRAVRLLDLLIVEGWRAIVSAPEAEALIESGSARVIEGELVLTIEGATSAAGGLDFVWRRIEQSSPCRRVFS